MMKKNNVIAAFMLVLLAVCTSSAPCKKYKCKNLNSADTAANPLCAKSEQTDLNAPSTIYLQNCTDIDQTCHGEDSLSGNNSYLYCVAKTHRNPSIPRLAGWFCEKNEQCLSGKCGSDQMGYCAGFRAGTKCTSDQQCGLYLFCNQTSGDPNFSFAYCAPTANLSQKCNDRHPCGFGLYCHQKKCIRMMSLPVGTLVSLTDPYAYRACSTLTVQAGQCTLAPTLSGNEGPRGKLTDVCRYNNSLPVLTPTASCGYSDNGNAFCPRGLGDFPDLLKALADEYFKKDPVCHYSELIARGCEYMIYDGPIYPTATLAKASYILAESLQSGTPYSLTSVLIQENDECTKTMMTSPYWREESNVFSNMVPLNKMTQGIEDKIQADNFVMNLIS